MNYIKLSPKKRMKQKLFSQKTSEPKSINLILKLTFMWPLNEIEFPKNGHAA